jgi:DNA repair exonuclease SbcCD ATPase subunit
MSGYSGSSAGGGPEAVLVELGRAISRAAGALAAIPDDDDVTAYKCARSLDAAFGDLTELLRTVPGIVGLGDPGRAVSERLEQYRAELATRRGEVTAHRQKLDSLGESERGLAELTAEADQLRTCVSELERAKRLASELPGLRIQVEALEEAVAAVGAADALEIGARITEAAAQFASVTERHQEAVSDQADKLVADADTAARVLEEQRTLRDAAAADLAKRESEATQLAADHKEMLPVLTAWSQADADFAAGLRVAGFESDGSALETVAAELNGIRQRLADLDNVLRPLLADQAKAYEDARRIRTL